MFCSKCGNQLPEGAAFCNKCGQKVEIKILNPTESEVKQTNIETPVLTSNTDTVTQPQSQVNGPVTAARKKSVFPVVIAAVVVIVLCAVLYLLFFKKTKTVFSENGSLVLAYDSNQKITRIVYNDVLLDNYLHGDESYSKCESSLDGNTYVIKGKDRTLYIIDAQGIKTIAYDVNEFSLSYNGNGLIYSDAEENIFIYDCINKEKTKITHDNSNHVMCLCISPDGQSAAYTEYDDGEYVLYSYVENEKQKVGKNILPLAISDNAANYFVYASNSDCYLYYMDSHGEKERIASSFNTIGCVLNKNNTEIMFYDGDWFDDDGRYYYFSSSSGEKIMLFDKERSSYDAYTFPPFICPNDTLFREYSVYYESGAYGSGTSKIVSSESLRNGAVYLYEENTSTESCNLITVDSEGEKKKMRINPIENFDDFYFNGNILSYSGHIYKYDITTDELEGIYSLDFDTCDNLIVSNGGQTIYYTRNGHVYCAHDAYASGKYEEKELGVSRNVDRMILLKGRYLLFESNDKMYISDNGGEPMKVSAKAQFFLSDQRTSNSSNYTYINSMVYSEKYYENESDIYILKPDGESELIAENGKYVNSDY